MILQQHPQKDSAETSTEFVLNVAFFTFIGFCILEAIFAFMANSQSMMADAAAMSIDALTYLFNLGAEWCKNQPLSEEMRQLSSEEQAYRVELRTQYLELIPPSISVVILIVITIVTTIQAVESLMGEIDGTAEEVDVSVALMFGFSAANLLLDIVNVTCFSRAKVNYGMDVVKEETIRISQSLRGYDLRRTSMTSQESSSRLSGGTSDDGGRLFSSLAIRADGGHKTPSMRFSNYGALMPAKLLKDENDDNDDNDDEESAVYINLNMCSAWTVRWVIFFVVHPVTVVLFISLTNNNKTLFFF